MASRLQTAPTQEKDDALPLDGSAQPEHSTGADQVNVAPPADPEIPNKPITFRVGRPRKPVREQLKKLVALRQASLRRTTAPIEEQEGSLPPDELAQPEQSTTFQVSLAPFADPEIADKVKALRALRQPRPVDLTRHPPYTPRLDDDSLASTRMRRGGTITIEGDRVAIGSVFYVPLSVAAVKAQTTEKNLRDWIKRDIFFRGKPIQTHTISLTGNKLYISEDSVRDMAERFVKWPSDKPAGLITIGKDKNKSGFVSMPEAARILGVSPRTMWLWAKMEKAPTTKTLDIVKCTTSDRLYIREKDVFELKKDLPRTGLHRGRRPQRTCEPVH
jgi:hypothetical protein